jgi:protein-glutamine gamma-glutamyltransferase
MPLGAVLSSLAGLGLLLGFWQGRRYVRSWPDSLELLFVTAASFLLVWGLTELAGTLVFRSAAAERKAGQSAAQPRLGALSWAGIVVVSLGAGGLLLVRWNSTFGFLPVALVVIGTGLLIYGAKRFVDRLVRGQAAPVARQRVGLTRPGAMALIMAVLLLAGAYLGPSNMLMLVFVMVVGPFIVNGWYAFGMIRRLTLARAAPQQVIAGEPVMVTLTLTNRKRFLSSWLMAATDTITRVSGIDAGERLTAETLFPRVPAREGRDAGYRLRVMRRGRYAFGPVQVRSRFPLGLVERSLTFEQPGELIVAPQLGRLTDRWHRDSASAEELVQRQRPRRGAFPDEFEKLRSFRYGDNPRMIHWRTSARQNTLMVREYHEIRDRDLLILLDLSADRGARDDALRIELAVSFAATVCVDQLRRSRQSQLGLAAVGRELATWTGVAHPASAEPLLRTLALLESSPHPDTGPLWTFAREQRTPTTAGDSRHDAQGRGSATARDGGVAADSQHGGRRPFGLLPADLTLMSDTRRQFTLSLYAVACLAAALLAGAEGGWLIPAALTLPIAVAAYALVEHRAAGIPTPLANALGLAAVAGALIELAVRDVEGRILFGAHMLVYLSWILLWQEKGSRQRWGLIALSVLQVAIGAVLTSAGSYGIGMAGFLVLTVWTLVLLQLDEAESRHARSTGTPAAEPRGPESLLARGSVAAAKQAALGRWPTRQIAAAVAVTVVGAAAVGGAFFVLIPRFELGRATFDETTAPLARQRITGFTETVRLGSFGEILESSVPVFEVRLFDRDRPVAVEDYAMALGLDEPLFRGLTLRDYDNGSWTTGEQGRGPTLPRWPFADQIRQEYRLQPLDSQVLFAIAPVYAGDIAGTDDQIRRQAGTGTLLRPRGARTRGELVYEVHSPANAAMAERFRLASSVGRPEREREEFQLYRQFPDGLDQIQRLAADVARPGGDEPAERRAERLLTYLRDSGEFVYTLTGELADPRLDPVEDFLVNRKAGHCEYFASALALMLRAEGVPSRVVSGFKGGERNRFNGAFEVQQRHAHAWVEAYLNDRWVTLDPSPAAGRSVTVAANAPPVPLWSDVRAAASNFWRDYVVQMNLSTQRRTLAPVRDAATTAIRALRQEWWPAIKSQLYGMATDPSRWFSWQGGIVTFLGLLMLIATWRVGRLARLRWSRLQAARAARLRRGRRVEFYERFRQLCERESWTLSSGQTPREFAARVRTHLAERPIPSHLALFPVELTEDFYRVRFGDIDLPEPRIDALNTRLHELEQALSAGGPGRRNGSSGRGAERGSARVGR